MNEKQLNILKDALINQYELWDDLEVEAKNMAQILSLGESEVIKIKHCFEAWLNNQDNLRLSYFFSFDPVSIEKDIDIFIMSFFK